MTIRYLEFEPPSRDSNFLIETLNRGKILPPNTKKNITPPGFGSDYLLTVYKDKKTGDIVGRVDKSKAKGRRESTISLLNGGSAILSDEFGNRVYQLDRDHLEYYAIGETTEDSPTGSQVRAVVLFTRNSA